MEAEKKYPYKDSGGWWHPICCNCRNRRNLEVCRDAAKRGTHTIEECESYDKVIRWR